MSRRLRMKWRNSNKLIKPEHLHISPDPERVEDMKKAFAASGLPTDEAIVMKYPDATTDPINDAFGNDDRGHENDEENNIYSENESIPSSTDINPLKQGVIGSQDHPNSPFLWEDAPGKANDTVEIRWHFGEFARALIGQRWYRISDFQDWRIHVKYMKAANGKWIDGGSETEPNNNGF